MGTVGSNPTGSALSSSALVAIEFMKFDLELASTEILAQQGEDFRVSGTQLLNAWLSRWGLRP